MEYRNTVLISIDVFETSTWGFAHDRGYVHSVDSGSIGAP